MKLQNTLSIWVTDQSEDVNQWLLTVKPVTWLMTAIRDQGLENWKLEGHGDEVVIERMRHGDGSPVVSWWFVRQRQTPEAVSMVTELFHKQFNIWEMSRARSPSALRNISEETGKTLRIKLRGGGLVENVFCLKHGCSVSGALDGGCVFLSTFTCIRVWSWICFRGTLWGGCL